jgi:hypothetical protein
MLAARNGRSPPRGCHSLAGMALAGARLIDCRLVDLSSLVRTPLQRLLYQKLCSVMTFGQMTASNDTCKGRARDGIWVAACTQPPVPRVVSNTLSMTLSARAAQWGSWEWLSNVIWRICIRELAGGARHVSRYRLVRQTTPISLDGHPTRLAFAISRTGYHGRVVCQAGFKNGAQGYAPSRATLSHPMAYLF